MDVEDPKFSSGKDQAKNYERLKKHLANTVQGKCGAPLAHTLSSGEDCAFPPVAMEPLHLTAPLGEAQIDKELCKTRNEEKRAKCEMEQEEQKKKQATHDGNKEKLCDC